MNKISKIFICIFVFISVFSFNVFADDITYTEGPFKYVINEDNCITITEYFGEDTIVNIPRSIGYFEENGETFPYMVTRIAIGAFTDSEIDQVNIPDTVLFIEEGAFNNGTNIEYYYGVSNTPDETREPETIVVEPLEKDEKPEGVIVNGEESEEIIIEETTVGENPTTGVIEEIWDIGGDVSQEEDIKTNTPVNDSYYLLFIGLICLGGLVFYYFKKRNKKSN